MTPSNVTLNDFCYKQIKDNFWYGLFGDFKLIIDKNTGYFNATKMCASGGKRLVDWKRLDGSKKLIKTYIEKAGVHIITPASYEITGDNKHKDVCEYTGTYVPRELILSISTWISPDFYFKCNDIVTDYFYYQMKSENEEFQKKLKDVEYKMSKLYKQNELNETFIDKMIRPTKDNTKHHMIVIIQTGDDDDNAYRVIRSQYGTALKRLEEHKVIFPDMTIVLEDIVANSVAIYNKLKESGHISFNKNRFTTTLTRDQLVKLVKGLIKHKEV